MTPIAPEPREADNGDRVAKRIHWGCVSGWIVTCVVFGSVGVGNSEFGFQLGSPFGASIMAILWFGIGSLIYSRKCPREERSLHRWASGITLGISLGVVVGVLIGGVFMWVTLGIAVLFIAVTKYLMRD